MNDRFLFKAKRKNWQELPEKYWWVQWNIFSGCPEAIDESTICQCTGLKDKNGTLIWENDVCKYYNSEDRDGVAVIEEDYAKWIKGTISKNDIMTPLFYLQCSDEWEVVGNIFDNPELLEIEQEEELENE